MFDFIAVPFGYLMRFLYQLTGHYAIALILFTLAVKLLLLPLSIRQHLSSVKQAKLRPKERAIRKRYEGRTDPEARVQLATELQNMYKEEKYNVAGGCLPLLIQLPIIIVLYRIVQQPMTYISRLSSETILALKSRAVELSLGGLTADSAVAEINLIGLVRDNLAAFSDVIPQGTLLPEFMLFGNVDLAANPSFNPFYLVLIPVLAGAFQWLSSFIIGKLMPKPEATPETASVNSTMNTMNIIMPIITVIIAFRLPNIMGLYWIYQSIFGIITQIILYKTMPIPTFTEEEYRAVEEEMNRDYVPVPVTTRAAHSLHSIDEDDEEYYEDLTDGDDADGSQQDNEPIIELPRRRYDKNGNPIRSLHYIDADDDESAVKEEVDIPDMTENGDTDSEDGDGDSDSDTDEE